MEQFLVFNDIHFEQADDEYMTNMVEAIRNAANNPNTVLACAEGDSFTPRQ